MEVDADFVMGLKKLLVDTAEHLRPGDGSMTMPPTVKEPCICTGGVKKRSASVDELHRERCLRKVNETHGATARRVA